MSFSPPATADERRPSWAVPFALLAILSRLPSLAGLHPLVWDEVEFFRATDWVRRGLVPYRDFWEHHTPLQWFLFAPFSHLVHGPGAATVLAMRWVQIPLWVLTFRVTDVWMRRAGIATRARWIALIAVLSSSLFMLPAVEYRVDVAGCFFLMLTMVLVQGLDEGRRYGLLAGASCCFTALANLRLGPILAVGVVLLAAVRIRERRWGPNFEVVSIVLGGVITLAAALGYCAATHSLAITIQRVWTDNYIADRLAPTVPHMFLTRVAAQFGVRRAGNILSFDISSVDPAGILILTLGFIGLGRTLWTRRRAPDGHFLLAAVALVNLLFIARMKFIYNYHFESVVLTLVPFVAIELGRMRIRHAVPVLLVVLLIVNASVALFRGKEGDTEYQDLVMRTVDASTTPADRVWDGVGWAVRRDSAYRYWFLRAIVTVMERDGRFEPYEPSDFLRDPPGAIVADFDTKGWMARHPALGRVVISHYLPLWPDLWLPAPNARLSGQSPGARWVVPADGRYRIFCSERLADHPWFRQPLSLDAAPWHDTNLVTLRPSDASAASVRWSVNDVPQIPGVGFLDLARGDRLMAVSDRLNPVGVMLIRVDPAALFRHQPPGVTLEGSFAPRWHVPDLGVLSRVMR